MSWKPKYFILYTNDINEKITWPEGWGNTCRANIVPMLREVLNTKSIGSEIKIIWNSDHEYEMIKKYGLTYDQLREYLNAKSGSLHFETQSLRKITFEHLQKIGAENLTLVDDYKKVILYQSYFYNHGFFPEEIIIHNR